MKFPIPKFLRGAPEDPTPVQEADLSSAQAELAKCEFATMEAQAAFDLDPGAAPALQKAKDAEAQARLFVERAQRLVAAAKEREAEEQERAREARQAELHDEIADLEVRRTDAFGTEMDALADAVAARAARRDVEVEELELQRELHRIQEHLYGVHAPAYQPHNVEPSTGNIADALSHRARGCAPDDVRRHYWMALLGYIERLERGVWR